jgi:hypothetical protein
VYQKTASDVRMKTAQENAPLAFNPITDSPAPASTRKPGRQFGLPAGLQTIRSETMDQAERMGLPLDVARDLAKNNVAKAYALTLAHLIDRKGGNPADLKLWPRGFSTRSRTTCPPRPGQGARTARGRHEQKDKALSAGDRDQGLDRRHQRAGAGTRQAVQGRRDHLRRARRWPAAPARGQLAAPRRAGRKRQGDARARCGTSRARAAASRTCRPATAGVHQEARAGRARRPDFQAAREQGRLRRQQAVRRPDAHVHGRPGALRPRWSWPPLSGQLTKAHWNQLDRSPDQRSTGRTSRRMDVNQDRRTGCEGREGAAGGGRHQQCTPEAEHRSSQADGPVHRFAARRAGRRAADWQQKKL